MALIFDEMVSQLPMKLIGVADPNPQAVGYRYAQEKGIYVTRDYLDLYKLNDLDMIIELTGLEEVANEISQTKPDHIRFMDHVAAHLFWDIFQIEEERVAEHQRAEEALRQKDKSVSQIESLSRIVQASSIPTFVIDNTHTITHWNRACENLTGISAEEIIGTRKQWLAFYSKKRPVMADLIVDNAPQEAIMGYYGDKCRESQFIEGAHEAEDFYPDLGERGKWLFFTAAPLKNVDGKITGAIETLQDVSDRNWAVEELKKYRDHLEDLVEKRTEKVKKANEQLQREIAERKKIEEALRSYEDELKESEEKYRTLFNSTPNSIFLLEQGTSKILDVNARAPEIYGFKREELIGMSFMDLGTYHYTQGILSASGQQSSMLSSVYPKLTHYRKDGTPFYVNVYARQSNRSHKYGIVAATVDITESLAKESQLIQASKMSTLGEMASGVAHELNQPLSALQIGADFIRDAVNQNKECWEDLSVVSNHMREQVDRATHIINHLREFGRKTDIKKERVHINDPIEGVFTLLGQQLKVRGIEVVLDLEDDLPPIMGNMNRLEQVFINLVVNARNAMEKKKEQFVQGPAENILTVKSYQENGQVVIKITDTGTGIPDEIRDKIFEPFFTTKGVGKGTGLGLSISYGIVKDYDGTIELESEAGKGATFKISFPASDEGQNGK
jgi:PAS domain S-box-containing protein